ncbi:hypothetical protein NM688_g5079 [Phlebia brevispora]|uniref:Uncharacterized protein n=1 Tax=Phlebia brevispora TaxID=194682 RepID=A0ACC1T149_9APHY|nr:hypothetical protein NM688_g5079 [Phlebia brevispora]
MWTTVGRSRVGQSPSPGSRALTLLSVIKTQKWGPRKSAPNGSALLERYRTTDVILIQEPYWGFIKNVATSIDANGVPFGSMGWTPAAGAWDQDTGIPYEQTIASRYFTCIGASPTTRVCIFLNKRLRFQKVRVRHDLIQHDDVLLIEVELDKEPFFILNAYNDSDTHAALVELERFVMHPHPDIHVLAGDFNLHHELWGRPSTQSRSLNICERFIDVCTLDLALECRNPMGRPTWESNNERLRRHTIDLVWMAPEVTPYDDVWVDLAGRNRSDHAVLSWTVDKTLPTEGPPFLKPFSDAELEFHTELAARIADLPCHLWRAETMMIDVERYADALGDLCDQTWNEFAKPRKLTKRSKTWWNAECTRAHDTLRTAQRAIPRGHPQRQEELSILKNTLRRAIKKAKRDYYERVMAETHSQRIWDLVEWTRPRKDQNYHMLTRPDGSAILDDAETTEAFRQQFFTEKPRDIDPKWVDDLPQQPERSFPPITEKEMLEQITETSNHTAAGPDHITWRTWKHVAKTNPHALTKLRIFFDAMVRTGCHPSRFKRGLSLCLAKPGRDHTKAKGYRPIILLDTLGKWFEKIIARRLQFDGQKFGILHPSQFGGTIQHSTTDAGVQLVHNIRQGWLANKDTTALLFDVSSFYPSLRHDVLVATMRKQGFHSSLCDFMSSYLADGETHLLFQGRTMGPVPIKQGVGQGSCLSPILSGLYIAPALFRVAPIDRLLSANLQLQVFVDDGFFYAINRDLEANCHFIARFYKDLVIHLWNLGIDIGADKNELIHFRRGRTPWDADLPLGPTVTLFDPQLQRSHIKVLPQPKVQYLEFYLDRSLTFKDHIKYFANKAARTIDVLRSLGNSVRGLTPVDKRRLYLSNVVPLMTYGAALWWDPKWHRQEWIVKSLQKAQNRAAIWITGAFRTSPIRAVEMIAGLVPVRHNVNKLMKRASLRARTLPYSHPLRAHLPQLWDVNDLNITAPFPLQDQGPGTRKALLSQVTPIKYIDKYGRTSTEDFLPLHDENRPGDRFLENVDPTRLVFDVKPPCKKGTDEFDEWLTDTLLPTLQDALEDPQALNIFTDGSVKKKTERDGTKKVLSAAACRIYRATDWHEPRLVKNDGHHHGPSPFACLPRSLA